MDHPTLKTLTYFIRGIINERLTSCFTCLDSAALFMLNYQQIHLFGWIQTSQTVGQLYSNTSPYEVSILYPTCKETNLFATFI